MKNSSYVWMDGINSPKDAIIGSSFATMPRLPTILLWRNSSSHQEIGKFNHDSVNHSKSKRAINAEKPGRSILAKDGEIGARNSKKESTKIDKTAPDLMF